MNDTEAQPPFLREVQLLRDRVPSFDAYPFSLPAVRSLHTLPLHAGVTFLVGENGSGKSTVLEAIALACGFNAEGGSRNFRFATRPSHSDLHTYLRVVREPRALRDGFFLRAESLFNVATEIERLDVGTSYGARPLHEQSHGEAFLAVMENRFRGSGLFLLDEPEAALSPSRQLSLLILIRRLVTRGGQFVIATHSPILMAYPDATIQYFGADGIEPRAFQDTEHYQITSDFLARYPRAVDELFRDE